MTFIDRFSDNDEIEVAGRMLRQVWRREVRPGIVRIERISSRSDRRQGLVVDADTELRIASHRSRQLVLWADSAPARVEITIPAPTEIRVWNVWSDDGLTQAWLGSAALHVRADGATTRLACRDGHCDPEASPTDLVVDIEVVDE